MSLAGERTPVGHDGPVTATLPTGSSTGSSVVPPGGPPVATHRRSAYARAAATAAEAARPRPRGPVRRFGRLVADLAKKGDRDRVLGLAGENAFMAVLTLFPILLVVAAVIGRLAPLIGEQRAAQVEDTVLDYLQELLTDSAAPVVDTARGLFETGGNTFTLTLALALFSLATAFASVINTVTLTYDVHDTRGWWFRRFLGLVVGAGSVLIAVVVMSLVVVGPLFAAEDVVGRFGLGEEYAWLRSRLRWPVAFLALVLWATTMYHVCPDRVGRWRAGLPGGLLAAVLWLAASVGFNLYLEVALDASPVFGALGGGLILMTWLYLLCLGLLIGAELNAVLLARKRLATGDTRRTTPGDDAAAAAAAVLAAERGHAAPAPHPR